MISKGHLRIKDSNFYKERNFKQEPIRHTVTDEDIYDPARICHIYGYKFDLWSVIARFNNIVDPFDDLIPGMEILIPTKKELKDIELEVK